MGDDVGFVAGDGAGALEQDGAGGGGSGADPAVLAQVAQLDPGSEEPVVSGNGDVHRFGEQVAPFERAVVAAGGEGELSGQGEVQVTAREPRQAVLGLELLDAQVELRALRAN